MPTSTSDPDSDDLSGSCALSILDDLSVYLIHAYGLKRYSCPQICISSGRLASLSPSISKPWLGLDDPLNWSFHMGGQPMTEDDFRAPHILLSLPHIADSTNHPGLVSPGKQRYLYTI